MVPNHHVPQKTAAGQSQDIASLMLIFPVVVNRLVFILSSLHRCREIESYTFSVFSPFVSVSY